MSNKYKNEMFNSIINISFSLPTICEAVIYDPSLYPRGDPSYRC